MVTRIFVAPTGNDQWSGALPEPNATRSDGPLATLQAARGRVRQFIAAGLTAPVEVVLRAGEYHLAETLVLGPQDSGTREHPITWKTHPGEQVTLSGGQVVGPWRKLEGSVQDLKAEAQAHVWVAEVPKGQRFLCLFDEQGLLPRAASPCRRTTDEVESTDRSTLRFEAGDIEPFENVQDAELFMSPSFGWMVNYLPIASIDHATRTLRTAIPGTYPLSSYGRWRQDLEEQPKLGLFGTRPPRDLSKPSAEDFSSYAETIKTYCIENALPYLSGPGQWVLDSRQGRLYLWPRDDQDPGQSVLYPKLREAIRLEGDFEQRRWAQHIQIQGLTFKHTERLSWHEGRIGVQHDWDCFDLGYAAVRLRGAQYCAVERCRFEHSGGSAVRLDRYAVGNTIRANEMRELGGAGVTLIGYGPGIRDENHNNTVSNNHIHHCARLWWHSPGILLCQSGHNRIANNLIHHLPYAAIIMVGGREGLWQFSEEPRDLPMDCRKYVNWDEIPEQIADQWYHKIGYLYTRYNVVEHNEVHHVMERLADGNGLYISGTGIGNAIRRNYFHDIEGLGLESAIRTDGWQWHTLITENVIWKVNGVGICVKQINDAVNNILVDCRRSGSIRISHGRLWVSWSYGMNVRRNICVQYDNSMTLKGSHAPFYHSEAWHPKFTEGKALVAQCNLEDNLFHCPDQPALAEGFLQGMRALDKEHNSLVGDPLFVNLSEGDFRLTEGSPALSLGFVPIDHWGLIEPVGPGD